MVKKIKPDNPPRTNRSRFPLNHSRPEHKRVVAICTGEKTEIQIIEHLKSELPHGVLCANYQKNIKDAIKYAMTTYQQSVDEDDPFDYIFIISDVDNLPAGTLRQQRKRINELEVPVSLILSKPCVEVWLSCYIPPVRGGSITIKGAQQEARRKGLTYGKGHKDVNVGRLVNHDVAIKEAKRLRDHCGAGADIIDDGPMSDMFEVLEYLEEEFKK